MGRHSTFTPQIAAEIVARLSAGEPLATMCRDDHMPGVRTVYEWRDCDPDFSAAIAGAREIGFDVIAADCLLIADDSSGDEIKAGPRYGQLDKEFAERSKIRIETRLKLLAKWDPKRYGDKQVVDLNVQSDIVTLIEAGRVRARLPSPPSPAIEE
jgi:hypothetical protein